MRLAHFPPERLRVGAHLTLFHALPGKRETEIAGALSRASADTTGFSLAVAGLRFLGHGVAYALASPEASALRSRLRGVFAGWLTAQDDAPWSAHVTVQNKVTPDVARATLARLASRPVPGPAAAIGIALWRYRGGPWERVNAWAFNPPP